MKKLVADMHMHTLVSGHAYGTIREMAEAAREKELLLIGITEHAPGIPGTVDPIYYSNLAFATHSVKGVKIMYGSEINILNDGTLSLPQKYIDYLDYAIVGIHGLCYTDAGREKNTDNLIEGIKNKKVCFISHPDDDHTPLNYERLVPAAKTYHAALEVNNSSFLKKPGKRLNYLENYKSMLSLCKHYQVPIIVNSDAHDPDSVGRFCNAQQLLEELQFPEELILNNDIEKLKQFLA